MSVLIILLNFLIPSADAAMTTPTACTGGTGTDYGGNTCYVPICDVSLDPSLGCVDSGGGPAVLVGTYRAYLKNPDGSLVDGYLNKLCTVDTDTAYDCYSITNASLTTFCNLNPVDFANFDNNQYPFTWNSTDFIGKKTQDIDQFCKTYLGS